MYRVLERRKDSTVMGYVRILKFNMLVEPILEDAICTLQERDGINSLVSDFRGNPGGAFQYVVEISSPKYLTIFQLHTWISKRNVYAKLFLTCLCRQVR